MIRGVLALQAEARQAKQNQVKLDAEQLEKLLFQLFERKVRKARIAFPLEIVATMAVLLLS